MDSSVRVFLRRHPSRGEALTTLKKLGLITANISLFCLLALGVSAQTQSQSGQPTGQPQLLTLTITVTDKSGRQVNDLRKEDLQVFDDGNLETISYFSKDEPPIAYGLVIDGSGSLKPQFQDILAAAKQIIATNQTEDLTFIIKFVSSDNIQTLQDLSDDKAALLNSLTGMKLEGGQTALIDGVYTAAEYVLKHQQQVGNRHFALVLISDGEDRASYFKESDLLTLLHKSDLQVFVIGLIGQLDDEGGFIRKSPRQKANELLMKLAQETEGRAFILNSPKELGNAINQLTMSLHSRYVIRYRPTKNPDKVRRKVQVKLVDCPEHEKWKVITGRVSAARN